MIFVTIENRTSEKEVTKDIPRENADTSNEKE